jgi:hypothetical protein
MAYGVVRTDKLMGTDVRSMLESVKYMGSGSTETAIDNGNVVKVDGTLMTGEREIKKGVTPAATDALDSIVLIATPEVMYDERKRNLDEFRNDAGKICRGYHLHSGDIFSVTADAVAFNTNESTDGKVGSVVELKADIKLNIKTGSATSGSTVVGSVIAIDVVGRYTYYVIQVA